MFQMLFHTIYSVPIEFLQQSLREIIFILGPEEVDKTGSGYYK